MLATDAAGRLHGGWLPGDHASSWYPSANMDITPIWQEVNRHSDQNRPGEIPGGDSLLIQRNLKAPPGFPLVLSSLPSSHRGKDPIFPPGRDNCGGPSFWPPESGEAPQDSLFLLIL